MVHDPVDDDVDSHRTLDPEQPADFSAPKQPACPGDSTLPRQEESGQQEPGQDELFESLLLAYDEALARGETQPPDERLVPPELQPRLRAALACVSLLARTRPPAATWPQPDSRSGGAAKIPARAKIARFDVLREIGRGGHGVVFLAVDPRLCRLVALKVPRPEVLVSPELHRRFLREGRAASALTHPNLVPIFEVGDDGPLCYIAAGYCEGPTLANWLKQQSSPLPWREASALVARLADATSHAHARGIVHRDIKPANILLAAAEPGSSGATSLFGRPVVPCLTDFGLARLIDEDASDRTRTGTMLGTPSYMAPEQADGRMEDVGPATDVYALGAVLYELLVGRAPFRGANDLETLRLVSAAQLVPPSAARSGLPRDLEAICIKALSPLPAARYPTAAALAADLRRFADGEPTQARPLGKLQKTWRAVMRLPVRSALAAATLLLMVIMAGGGVWYSKQLAETRKASRKAERHRDELRNAVGLRSAWQAFNNDNAFEARAILENVDSPLGSGHHDFGWRLLRSLTQKSELLTLTGHGGDVYHAAFSPDGAWLATASQDQTVRIWNAASGRLGATLAGHNDEVNAVAWSPDGMLLASASDDGTIRLWNAIEARAVDPVLRGNRGPIVSLAFSHDGAHLASGDNRGRIVFTDTGTWQTAKTFETGGGRVNGLDITRDGAWLAAATDKEGLRIWDLSGKLPPKHFDWFSPRARNVTFDRRGRLLGCGYTWAYLWDWRADREPKLVWRSPDYLNSITLCGGERLAATAGHDELVRVFSTHTGELQQTLIGHTERIWCVATSPNGWRLATASADDSVKLWALKEATRILASDYPTPFSRVAFADEGQTLIAPRDGVVERWRLRSASADAPAPAWQLADASPLAAAATWAGESSSSERRRTRDLAISPDGALAATCQNGEVGVSLINLHTGSDAGALAAQPDEPAKQTEAITFSPDGQMLVEAVGRSIRLWDVATRRIKQRLTANDTVFAIDLSPDGGRLAAAIGGRLELWDIAKGELLAGWPAHRSHINAVTFSTNGLLLASASQDRLVRLWEGTTGEAVATFSGHTASVDAFCFSPDGRLLASGSGDGQVKLWSLLSHEELATLKGFSGGVRDLAFSPRHLILAAVGQDHESGHLRLWCAGGPDETWLPLTKKDAAIATP